MEEMAISRFKATCLAVLERVGKTGKPVRVTRFGKPVAEVVPPSPDRRKERQFGAMAGTVRIIGDIISPATDPEDWDALGE
jgi:antitoxin (DNA-binding transcriptional repressor) of toxin-antitoxin stability system